MRPTEILMREHRMIERVLDCLETMARRADAGSGVDLASARQAIDFFRNFADRWHHAKEEECLFPLLEHKGFSREQGPTTVMLHEHESGRLHVRGMEQAADAIAAGDNSATAQFTSHAWAFTHLLRQHILKEDHCLFQMTDQALSEQVQSDLLKSFTRVEHDDMASGTHEKYASIADELTDRFGTKHAVSQTRGDSPNVSTGCGHH